MSIKALLSTLPYKLKQDVEAELYKNYIARCIRLLTENTAKYGGGSYITMEYEDIINPKKKDSRTGEEIVKEVIEKAGLEVIGDWI